MKKRMNIGDLPMPEKVLKSEAEFVRRCEGFVLETDVGDAHSAGDVFNDTAIHSFPSERLPGGSWGLWDRGPRPEYPEEADPELVRDVQEPA